MATTDGKGEVAGRSRSYIPRGLTVNVHFHNSGPSGRLTSGTHYSPARSYPMTSTPFSRRRFSELCTLAVPSLLLGTEKATDAAPAFALFDHEIEAFMSERNVPGAAIAVETGHPAFREQHGETPAAD